MAAEAASIRGILLALGCARQETRDAVTNIVGLSSVEAFVVAMGGDPESLTSETRKQLRDYKKEQAEQVPPVPVANRVDTYPASIASVKNLASIIDFCTKHGAEANVDIIINNSHQNAIQFYQQLYSTKTKADPTDKFELPKLKKEVAPNSPPSTMPSSIFKGSSPIPTTSAKSTSSRPRSARRPRRNAMSPPASPTIAPAEATKAAVE